MDAMLLYSETPNLHTHTWKVAIVDATDKSVDRITGNEISGLPVSLPVHIDDPLEQVRLTAMAASRAEEDNVPGPRERGHIGGAPVNEIHSIGILSAGSAFNMTVWSYVDQVDISILSDDRTFDDIHEATDAMIHGLAEIRGATTADVAGEILLIAGDDSHKLPQKDVGPALTAALGLPGVPPEGRPGDPDDDDGWFLTDWMDTTQAQEALAFQHHSWPSMLAEMSDRMGWKRLLLRPVAPLARAFLARRAAYRGAPETYADLWGAIAATLGDPCLRNEGTQG